jgi:Mn2+/Fe2+ NRAMP family transporter
MKRLLGVTLGILTAIGGFVDIGDLVANAESGARFGLALAWVVVVGVGGIVVYAEMCGRVAAVSGRPAFSLVRERLGPRFGLANLVASFFINFLTLTAELAGVAIAVSLVASVHYLLLVPFAALAVWAVIWRLPFEWMERIFGLAGLALSYSSCPSSSSAQTGRTCCRRRRTPRSPVVRRRSATPSSPSPSSARR